MVCDKKQVPQLIVKLTLLGAQHINEFDIFADNLKKKPTTGNCNKVKANAEKVKYRLTKLMSTSINETAKSWYAGKISEAEERLSAISNVPAENSTNEPEQEIIEIDTENPISNAVSGSKRRASASPTTLRRVNFPKDTPGKTCRTMILRRAAPYYQISS